MAKGTTVATAYVQVMPSMEGATSNITDAILPQINGAGDGLGKELGSSLGAGFKGMLDKLLPAATVAALATAASKALFEVGQTFDKMTDSIIIGTGASGEALDSLIGSAEKIATTIPASFEDAGDVVQNLNTRLGITGDELENLGARVLEAGNLIGEKLNLDSLTGALNAFGVSNEEAAGKLDYLFNVSQATGIGLNSLLGTLKKQAPALKELGFSFEESANIIGTMDKMGLDASPTMGKLSKVLAEAADNGEPAREAYERIVGELQHYLEIGDEVSALQLADEVFGTRGSAQFLDAVKSGALSLDNMKNSALGAGDGILGTMERTMSFGESLELLKNNALAALEPLASPIFDGLSGIMQKLTGILEKARGSFASIASVVGGVLTIAFNAVGGALDFLGGIFQTVFAFFEPILDALATDFDKITAALGLNAEEASEDSGIWQMLGDVFGFVGDLIATVITPVISVLSGVISAIMEPVQALADKFSSLWNPGPRGMGQHQGEDPGRRRLDQGHLRLRARVPAHLAPALLGHGRVQRRPAERPRVRGNGLLRSRRHRRRPIVDHGGRGGPRGHRPFDRSEHRTLRGRGRGARTGRRRHVHLQYHGGQRDDPPAPCARGESGPPAIRIGGAHGMVTR